MIEYLGNAIRAFAGSEVSIAMEITDATGTPITNNCKLNFRDKDRTLIKSYNGTYYEVDKVWNFMMRMLYALPSHYTFAKEVFQWI